LGSVQGGQVQLPVPNKVYSGGPGAPFPNVARHIWVAQHDPDSTFPFFYSAAGVLQPKSMPGAPGSQTLTRADSTTKKSNQDYSRDQCDILWTSSSAVCDEYPFASSNQGIRNAGFNFSLCPVPSNENSLAGSDLGTFYINNRILYNDPFT